MCDTKLRRLGQIVLGGGAIPNFRGLELAGVQHQLALPNRATATEDALVRIQTVDGHDDWLVPLVGLNLPTVLAPLRGCRPTLPLVKDLLDLVVAMQTLLPLEVLLVDQHLAIFDPVAEPQSVDHWELADARGHQAQRDVVGVRAVVEGEVVDLLTPLLEELDASAKQVPREDLGRSRRDELPLLASFRLSTR